MCLTIYGFMVYLYMWKGNNMTIFQFLIEQTNPTTYAMVRRWFAQGAVSLNGLSVTDKHIDLTPGDTVGLGRRDRWTYNG